jgi:hypothetical protein
MEFFGSTGIMELVEHILCYKTSLKLLQGSQQLQYV